MNRLPKAEEHMLRRVAIASAIGTAIGWYDFFLYGTAATHLRGVARVFR